MTGKHIMVSEEELKSIVKDATKEAVVETLTALGIDARNPLDTQQDFIFIRKMRVASDTVARNGLMAMATVLTTGMLAALWIGFKELLKQP